MKPLLLLMPPFSGEGENQIEPFAIKGKNVNPRWGNDCDSGQLRSELRSREGRETGADSLKEKWSFSGLGWQFWRDIRVGWMQSDRRARAPSFSLVTLDILGAVSFPAVNSEIISDAPSSNN